MVSLFTLLSFSFTIYADDVSVDHFSINSTQNDFANVTATITAHANYSYSFAAPYKFYKWNGSSWVYFNNRSYAWDFSYQGGTWSVTSGTFNVFGGEDYYGNFVPVTPQGNGQYKVRFEVNLLGIIPGSDFKEATFTVTDVVAPSAPTNLAVTASDNSHPYLTWDANTEIDVEKYKIYKKIGGGSWDFLAYTENTYYEDDEETVLVGHHANETYAYYKIKAVDYTSNESGYSSTVSIKVKGPDPEKITFIYTEIELKANQFGMFANYPNPFNPITKITFSIPQGRNVQINVYSITGEKVATLVDGFLEKGFHSVEWNSLNQYGNKVSSGIYIYELIAGDLRLVKKMLLAK